MKTAVQMKRPLFGMEISQKSDSEFFSATDLVKAGNKWRSANGLSDFNLSQWMTLKSTKEFASELEKKYGKVLIKGRGRSAQTWMHPLLFIDCALALSPKLKIETYEWLFDNLIKFRNESGDSYKKMSGAMFAHCKNKREFYLEIQATAKRIKAHLGCADWNRASEDQLSKRDKIQEGIALLCGVLRDNGQAVSLTLRQYD